MARAVQLPLLEEARALVEARSARRSGPRLGVPYQGSKNDIARALLAQLPAAEHFYDLMAGGCAVAQAAIESGKYGRVHANDITDAPSFFRDAVLGKFRDERRIIDRRAFHRLKKADPYVRYAWSFGTNGEDYLWGAEIEPCKLAQSRLVFSESWQDRLAAHRSLCEALLDFTWRKQPGEESLLRLQWYERLQSIQALEGAISLDSLEITRLDYRSVRIEPGAVVYCDMPYEGTGAEYCRDFDYEAFYAWAEVQRNIYISAYGMPADRFTEIWSRKRTSGMAATGARTTTERLYRPMGNARHV